MRSPDAARAARTTMSVVSTPVTGSVSGSLEVMAPVATTGEEDGWSTIGLVEVGAIGGVAPVFAITALGFGAAARGMRSSGAENSLMESVPAAIVVPFSAKAVRIVSLYDAPALISVTVFMIAVIGLVVPVIEATLTVSLVARSVIWTRRVSIWIGWLKLIWIVRISGTITDPLIRSGSRSTAGGGVVTAGRFIVPVFIVPVFIVPVFIVPDSVAARAVSGEMRIVTSAVVEMIGDLIWEKDKG
jgi:hypothetical protein